MIRLLFDENLSFKRSVRVQDIFPESKHVRDFGMEQVVDTVIWEKAKRDHFVIITNDSDFNDLSIMRGFPPYIVWLRIGNSRLDEIESVIRNNQLLIRQWVLDKRYGIIEIHG
ncbi:MAG: DUF5615 family PIN-like protein [Mariprofundales bacterium]